MLLLQGCSLGVPSIPKYPDELLLSCCIRPLSSQSCWGCRPIRQVYKRCCWSLLLHTGQIRIEMSDRLQDVLLQNDSILDAEQTLAGVSLFCWPLEVAGSSAAAPDDSCSSALVFCFLGSDVKKEAMPLFGAMLLCYWRLLL